jgi:hypothetical protein
MCLYLFACIKSGARVCMCLHVSRAERVSACVCDFESRACLSMYLHTLRAAYI